MADRRPDRGRPTVYGDPVPDRSFADPRLAAIYDDLEGDRSDLDLYEALVGELGATTVVDVGCGTGTLACRLAGTGLDVIGIDPARASLDLARAKPNGAAVEWREGGAADLPPLGADLAVMTGNVAQVFIADDEWLAAVAGVRRAVREGGHFVFETRNPAGRAWEEWAQRPSSLSQSSAGPVESSIDVTAIALPMVSFRWTYRFHRTGMTLTSDTTLRFRDRPEIEAALATSDFDVLEVRDAPDRPGREFVFIARAGSAPTAADEGRSP